MVSQANWTGSKRRVALAAIVTWMLCPQVPISADGPAETVAGDAGAAADHEALRALKREVEAAFNLTGRSGKPEDFEGVLAYVHDNAVLAAMNGELLVGKDRILDYFNRKMTGPSRTVQTVEHTFEPAGLTFLYGGDTGVAYGTSIGRYELVGGMTFEVNTNWTSTLVKENDRWLIAGFQFGPSIFDNPLLNKAVNSLYWGIGISGGAGLILGFLLGRFSGRRARTA